MNRVLIHVEGETEETFVNEILVSHLHSHGFVVVGARLLGNARQRDRRGGIQGWPASRNDIIRHLKDDPDLCCTTMVDYYALPQDGSKGWPGRAEAGQVPFAEKARLIEDAIFVDVNAAMGGNLHPDRFVPYVMMHEFEGLLFSDCQRFAAGIGREDLVGDFQAIRDQFGSPEEINDSPTTAPSKRVLGLVPGYQKSLLGTLAALEIGLETMREACPHFAEWLARLERIP